MSAGQTTIGYQPSAIGYISIQTQIRLADVSFWQGDINFDIMRSLLDGVIIRAGQRYWEDIRFKINWQKTKEAGLPRGSYWFYDSREDPKKQAALWWSLIQGDLGELVHVADFEESYSGPYGMPSHFQTFIQEFQRLSGLPDDKIAIYTGYFWWINRIGNNAFFRRFAPWIAWYAPMDIVRVPSPWIETDLIFWQYTPSGDGPLYGVSSQEIDLNWYCCDARAYSLRFGLGAPPTNGGTMPETYLKLTPSVPGEYRSIRESEYPNILGDKIGQINPNSTAKAYTDEGKVVYTQDVHVSGGLYAKAGDVWLKCFEANGQTINGMIAEIHKGIRYLLVETINPPDPEPTPALPDVLYIATQEDMSDKQKYQKAV